MSRFTFSGKPFVAALAGAALLGAASGSQADRLLPIAAMPEAQLTLVSNTGARAFDHIRAARQQIEARQAFEARQELAQARKLLAEARTAVPANRVQDRIAALLTRIEDPSAKLAYTDVDPIYAEIAAAGGGDAYGATWRYVERARFQLWNQDRDAATRELLAASARVPYGRIDAPLGASYERVNQAMILLYDLDLEGADALLAAAEDNAHAVVQIASGLEIPMEEPSVPDVAAPAEPMTAAAAPEAAAEIAPETAPEAAPTATESEIPAASEFQESAQEPAAVEEIAPTIEGAAQELTPELAPDVAAPPVTAPEIPAVIEEIPAAVEEIPAAVEEIPAAAEGAFQDTVEGTVQELTPDLAPDVSAPPVSAPEIPAAVEEIPAAVEDAAQDAAQDATDAIQELAPEATP